MRGCPVPQEHIAARFGLDRLRKAFLSLDVNGDGVVDGKDLWRYLNREVRRLRALGALARARRLCLPAQLAFSRWFAWSKCHTNTIPRRLLLVPPDQRSGRA